MEPLAPADAVIVCGTPEVGIWPGRVAGTVGNDGPELIFETPPATS